MDSSPDSVAAETILVVEDNQVTRKKVRLALEARGYHVLDAADGGGAIRLARAHPPALVVQGLLLRDMSGVELLERLRELPGGKETPVLAFSGLLPRIEEARALRAGFSEYLFKPVEPARLVQAVAAHLPRPSAPAGSQGGDRLVLLVDDNPVQLKLGKIQLEHRGFTVMAAAGGAEALERARVHRPDVVVTDLLMPVMGGLDLCLAMRRDPALADIPVIVTSASFTYLESADHEVARDAGASAFVVRTPDFQLVTEALFETLRLDGPPPRPTADAEAVRDAYTGRLIKQLEHQATLNASLARRTAQDQAQLSIIASVAQVLSQEVDLDTAIEEILARTLDAAGTPVGAVFLWEPGEGLHLHSEIGYAAGGGSGVKRFFGHEELLQRVIETGEALLVPSAGVPESTARDVLSPSGARSMCLVPLAVGGKPHGVLVLTSPSQALDDEWVASARSVGVQLAQAIHLARNMEALASSERRFRELWNNAPLGLYRSRPEGTLLDVNEALVRLLGFPDRASLLATRVECVYVHPEERKAFLEILERDGSVSEFEVLARCADGGEIWLENNARLVRDEDGGVLYYEGALTDISKRRRAQDDLEERERAYRLQVDQAADAILIADREGRLIDANVKACEMLGRSHDEILDLSVVDVYVPEERAEVAAGFEKARRGDHNPVERRLQRKDGTALSVEVSATSLPDHRVQAILRDVTGRKLAEAALRESEERFRLIAEHITEAFFLTQIEPLQSLYLSPPFEEIWGIPVADVYASPALWIEAVHADDRPAVFAIFEAVRRGEATTTVFRVIRPDRTTRWVRARVSPVPDPSGVPQRLVGVASDITELKRIQEQATQAQKMEAVGRLAGGVAHDFNNLLTVILAEAELLLRELPAGSTGIDPLLEIRKAGNRAAVLTRQLLAFSRRQLVEPTVFEMNGVVVDMEKMLRRLIGEDVEIVVRLGREASSVLADRGQMEQVLANLVVNARDAMPDGGTLTLETHNVTLDASYALQLGVDPGRYILLVVSDTGTGMTDEVKERVFEPFFTTKERGKGTGLGLATCYGIVKQGGGHVAIYSEAGIGTTVKVYLPQMDSGPTSVTARVESVPTGRETILLVEDDAQVRRVANRLLVSLGYHVMGAADGREALHLTESHPGTIDLLLTDVVLPGMGGRELADQVRSRRPGTRILFMSGYTDDVILQHKLLEQDIALLQKPFSRDSLATKVRAVLDA